MRAPCYRVLFPHPVKSNVAVELKGSGRTEHIDIADGEGYISSDGQIWEPAEGARPCNVCLKAYGIRQHTDRNERYEVWDGT